MKISGPWQSSATAAMFLLAVSAFAQRYQPRDHHVFHPPVQAKHQPVAASSSTNGHTHAAPTSVATSRHEVNFNGGENGAVRTPRTAGAEASQPR